MVGNTRNTVERNKLLKVCVQGETRHTHTHRHDSHFRIEITYVGYNVGVTLGEYLVVADVYRPICILSAFILHTVDPSCAYTLLYFTS